MLVGFKKAHVMLIFNPLVCKIIVASKAFKESLTISTGLPFGNAMVPRQKTHELKILRLLPRIVRYMHNVTAPKILAKAV